MSENLIFCFLLQTFKEPIYKDVVLNFSKPCAWWTHSSHLWRHLGSASKIPHCHQDACCFGEKRIKTQISESLMFNQWFCAVVYFFFLSRPIFASDTESSSITSGLSDQRPLDIIVASSLGYAGAWVYGLPLFLQALWSWSPLVVYELWSLISVITN